MVAIQICQMISPCELLVLCLAREDLREGRLRLCCRMVRRSGSVVGWWFWVVVLGGGVVKLGWVGEEKREQRRKERCPYTDQPGLLLHLNCMTLRHAEAPVAEHKQNLE